MALYTSTLNFYNILCKVIGINQNNYHVFSCAHTILLNQSACGWDYLLDWWRVNQLVNLVNLVNSFSHKNKEKWQNNKNEHFRTLEN